MKKYLFLMQTTRMVDAVMTHICQGVFAITNSIEGIVNLIKNELD